MGTIILIILFVIFMVHCETNGENVFQKIIETAIGIGMMVLAFIIGGYILMMMISFIASL